MSVEVDKVAKLICRESGNLHNVDLLQDVPRLMKPNPPQPQQTLELSWRQFRMVFVWKKTELEFMKARTYSVILISKRCWLANSLDFERYPSYGSPTIWNPDKLLPFRQKHFKSRRKCPDFEWSSLRMVGTIAITNPLKTEPFESCFRILNGFIIDPHSTWKSLKLYVRSVCYTLDNFPTF